MCDNCQKELKKEIYSLNNRETKIQDKFNFCPTCLKFLSGKIISVVKNFDRCNKRVKKFRRLSLPIGDSTKDVCLHCYNDINNKIEQLLINMFKNL